MSGGNASGYPAIGDYGIIGDGRTAALVSSSGSIDWLCLPDFDDASVFAALLDRHTGGRLSIAPCEGAEVTRSYVDDTSVLETRFHAGDGTFRVVDFLPLMLDGRAGRFEPERQVVRIVEALSGRPKIDIVFAPRPDYGRTAPRLERRGALGWTFAYGADFYLFQTDLDIALSQQDTLAGQMRLAPGRRYHVSLSFTRRDIGVVPQLGEELEQKLDTTRKWWNDWAGRLAHQGPFRNAVVRSLVTLRLLTFNQSGAVIAAATTSLPEAVGGTRNWDYRYCWLRDASFIMRSFLGLGYREEARAFLQWLVHATRLTAPRLNAMYTLYGRSVASERTIDYLEGWRGTAPVRVGNSANRQLQLDVYGAVALAIHDFVANQGELDSDHKRLVRGFADVICERWTEPDNGIWEYRRGRMHNTYSKAMCWAALDCIIQLGENGHIAPPSDRYLRERDQIRETVEREAWNEELQCYTAAFGRDFIDASLLLLPRIGFCDPGSPRMRATFDRIDRTLTRNGFVRRYDPATDSFPSGEGAFLACSFWAAEYLARRGDWAAARERMEHLLAHANDLGLYAEEIDPETGEALGNFPQAYSHTSLINAALALAGRAEEDARS